MIELLLALVMALNTGTVCDLGDEIDGRAWAETHAEAQGVALIGARGDFEIMVFAGDDESNLVFYYFDYDGTRRHVECARMVEVPDEGFDA